MGHEVTQADEAASVHDEAALRTGNGRRVAPGGLHRAIVGFAVGALAGLAAVRAAAKDRG